MLPHPLDVLGHAIASVTNIRIEGTVSQFQAEVLRRPGKTLTVFLELLPSTMRNNASGSH